MSAPAPTPAAPTASASAAGAPPHDILIACAGPAGLALGLALTRLGRRQLVVDARPPGTQRPDPRILALSHGSRQILEWLGAWPRPEPGAIRSIHVSQRGGFGRARLTAAEEGLPALGYVVEASALAATLQAAARRAGLPVLEGTRLAAVSPGDQAIEARLEGAGGAETRPVQLVAWAEGAVADGSGIMVRDYEQDAVLTVATAAEPAHGTAWERFTPDGPIAVLPLGRAWAVVFVLPRDQAAQVAALDDAAFLARLQAAFGTRLRFLGATPRATHPLVLRWRRTPIGPRQVWLGNAAQTLHPVGGQGFNLALRDIRELAERLADAPDAGAPEILRAHASARQLDRYGAMGFTDGLIRLFCNDDPLLRAARGAGLFLLDMLPPARSFLARRMIFGARAWP
ncbi:MAG: FAD-dependent monooxygenase [Betaproteobacteria bacterium]|nr:FAD-dependent monooxygenase [Betaproteobacteria bacterium]